MSYKDWFQPESFIVPYSKIPERIGRIREIAGSLWWSWHPNARNMFRMLDYPLWSQGGHNPIQQLYEISHEKLEAAARDASFLALYDAAVADIDNEIKDGNSWYAADPSRHLTGPVAYFSMEFAIHSSLPIYAGGLGVLAGDLCKEASDMGIPMVAVGFMYPQGYFKQRISAEGWQEEEYQQIEFSKAPATRILSKTGEKCLIEVKLKNRTLHIGAWLVNLGRVNLYLIDTGLEENEAKDRQLSSRLYTADREQRLEQEIILGIGGVRILRELGIKPAIWHANEGHTAFMMLERIREEVASGSSYQKALENVQRTSIFTTHTPVPAGHDTFHNPLIEQYFNEYWPSLGIDRKKFLELGHVTDRDDHFNMTILSLKTAGHRNAVSRLHGVVTRHMWCNLWPECRVDDEVPITYVTNGVHVPTWIAQEIRTLFDKYLGKDWIKKQDNIEMWRHINDIPDQELWQAHQVLKGKLFHVILERAQARWAKSEASAQQILSMGSLLDHGTLTIGFVRRFAEYKRPSLIFQDLDRIKKIVNDTWRPVQIIFAGKSHPADTASKLILQRAHTMARDRAFQGRIAFLEDYDMHLARYLVQGVDVWMNVPRRMQEASGTSGMKASLNGVLHMSVPDGWWHEGYVDGNGWAVGDDTIKCSPEEEDRLDAESVYNILEEKVIPLYYNRDRQNMPQEWVAMMKRCISSITPVFSAHRMVKDYYQKLYLPASKGLMQTGK
jgi:glycogen phosphorylase